METLIKKFKKIGTDQLIAKVAKLTGDEKTACIAVLKLRGQDVSKWDSTPEPAAPAKPKAEPKAKAEPKVEEKPKAIKKDKIVPAEQEGDTEPEVVTDEPVKHFAMGQVVKFQSSKNSKKAPGLELTGEVMAFKTSEAGKTFLLIKVAELGHFLKESSKCQ